MLNVRKFSSFIDIELAILRIYSNSNIKYIYEKFVIFLKFTFIYECFQWKRLTLVRRGKPSHYYVRQKLNFKN